MQCTEDHKAFLSRDTFLSYCIHLNERATRVRLSKALNFSFLPTRVTPPEMINQMIKPQFPPGALDWTIEDLD